MIYRNLFMPMQVNDTLSLKQTVIVLAWFALSLWILLLFIQKTNLAASDLGRHLTNGRIISQSGSVFQNNLYSYTNLDFSAPNHHWLFGVIVFQLFQVGGFGVVTITVAGIYWLGITASLWLSKRLTNNWIPLLSAFVFLPIIAMRRETRPGAFSVLGISMILLVCHWLWIKQSTWQILSALAIVIALTLIWTNTHILFILGFLVTGSYLLIAFFSRSYSRILTYVGLLLLQLSTILVNPQGWQLLLYPLQIMRDYQYPVAENQSILFFLQYHPSAKYIYLFAIVLVTFVMLLTTIRKVSLRLYPIWLITFVLALATLQMNRFSAFFQIPALIVFSITFFLIAKSKQFSTFFDKRWLHQPMKVATIAVGMLVAIGIIASTKNVNPISPAFGTGITDNVEAAGNFFTTHNLPGPIFNNYDIGGYLIYKLYPSQSIFVDNRPEAYPGSFLKNEYIAAQQDEATWLKLEKKYGFNTIFFYRHDATDWVMPFLIRRIEDESWVPVYVDEYSLILLKQSPANQQLIDRLALPKSMFQIQKYE